MRNKQFYPSYIPGKWIHYTHHKKKRIRKKYRNKIRRAARDRACRLLHSLATGNSQEEQDDAEAGDDEEVP